MSAPLPPQTAEGQSAADLAELRQAMEGRVVKERLGQLGMTPQEVEAKLKSLTPEEVHQLAAQVQEIQAGGDGGVELLAVVLLAILLFIVIMELLGRRIISRG